MKYKGYTVKKHNLIVDGIKQHSYLCLALQVTATTIKDIKNQIDKVPVIKKLDK